MVVLDTHIVFWLAGGSPMLSKTVVEKIEAARKSEGLCIAGITLYEIAWLVQNRRVSVKPSLKTFLDEVETHFHVLPLTALIAQIAVNLPETYPADPADRQIGATALAHGAALVTRDRLIRKSKAVPVIW